MKTGSNGTGHRTKRLRQYHIGLTKHYLACALLNFIKAMKPL